MAELQDLQYDTVIRSNRMVASAQAVPGAYAQAEILQAIRELQGLGMSAGLLGMEKIK